MPRRSELRRLILERLEHEPIHSLLSFLWDVGSFDYSYGLNVFRQLQREELITMVKQRGKGQPWLVTQGPKYNQAAQQ
jgi:hypothetical protein